MENEKRLTDVNPIIRNLTAMKSVYDAISLDGMIKALEDAPAVEDAEVVRCKDCKHWLKDVPGCTDFVGRCEWANYMIGATGYCVYGERSGDNAVD